MANTHNVEYAQWVLDELVQDDEFLRFYKEIDATYDLLCGHGFDEPHIDALDDMFAEFESCISCGRSITLIDGGVCDGCRFDDL